VLLVPVYVAATWYSLDFEFRRESHSVTLTQLPLALGLYVVSPATHLGTRLVASLLSSWLTRQDRLKTLYDLAAGAFEVGAAAFAVGLVPEDETGPVMWLALYGGLLVGDVAGALVLNAIWRRLGMRVGLRETAHNLLLLAPVGLLFTGLAIVAINAALVEELTAVVMLGLVFWLALAYRAAVRRAVVPPAGVRRPGPAVHARTRGAARPAGRRHPRLRAAEPPARRRRGRVGHHGGAAWWRSTGWSAC